MVYLDNAATTKNKPEEVYDAFDFYVRNIGVSPGRGSYQLGIESSRMLYKTRKKVSSFFGNSNSNVIFTKNSTEAINLFLNGFLKHGDHVILSCYEHNAVLRPLANLKEKGIVDYSVITREDMLLSNEDLYKKYTKPNTKLFISTLASNLTGRIVFDSSRFNYMRRHNIKTFLDSSQGASKIRVNMEEDGIDFLAFTGHKDLLALPGVGGLVSKDKLEFSPLLQGGTGVLGDQYVNPKVYPEAYEAGTINMPSIWSLNAAIDWIEKNEKMLLKNERSLTLYLLEKLSSIKKVQIYDMEYNRVGVIGFNIIGFSSSDIVKILDENGICARGGIHCAILAHEALGTVSTGVVRISLGWNNTKQDIDDLIEVLERRIN